MTEKALDDIVEITEQQYFQTLYDNKKRRMATIKTKEFEEYRSHGFKINFYYNNTKQVMFYELVQTGPIGFKYKK